MMKNHLEDTHELVCDYIYYNKLGKEAYRADTKVAATLRQVGKKVEACYPMKTMAEIFNIKASKPDVAFRNVVDIAFSQTDGVDWGYIVVVVCLASEVAVSCSQHGNDDVVDNIVGWLSEYLSKGTIGEWIKQTGGWEAFVEHWKVRDVFWWLRTSITILSNCFCISWT